MGNCLKPCHHEHEHDHDIHRNHDNHRNQNHIHRIERSNYFTFPLHLDYPRPPPYNPEY